MGTDPSPAFGYFHGGGYRGGNKSNIHHRLAARLCMAGITSVSANYRLSDDSEYLAPLLKTPHSLPHWTFSPVYRPTREIFS